MIIEYNKNYHPVGRNVRRLRRKYHLSRRALAALAGVSPKYLRRLEAGRLPPTMDSALALRLAEIFPLPPGRDIFSPGLL